MKSMMMTLALVAMVTGCAAEQVGSPGALAAPPPATASAEIAVSNDGAQPAGGQKNADVAKKNGNEGLGFEAAPVR